MNSVTFLPRQRKEKLVRAVLEQCACAILRGGVVIFPTDTVYGFTGNYFDPRVRSRIRSIKLRDSQKGFIVLCGSVDMAVRCAAQEIPAGILALWPAPLTLVVQNRYKQLYGEATLAVRVPQSSLLLRLLGRVGVPLISTSVNLSNQPCVGEDRMVDEFGAQVDCVVIDESFVSGVPSTVLDIHSSPFRILRQGAFDVAPELLE